MPIITDKIYDMAGNVRNVRPQPHETVKLKKCGNITEIQYLQKISRGGTTRKISKTEYFDIRDGIVKEFELNDNRADDKKSVSRSMKQGRDMINANATDPLLCKWITLTYAENMTDPKKLHTDFKAFMKLIKQNYPTYDKYILATEPQGRGAFHGHLLLIFTEKAPYMENSAVRKLWGHGFVTVRNLDNVDNIGAYLSAYLADIPLDEAEPNASGKVETVEQSDENGRKVKKRVIKGGRLHMYPSGMHIFRWSRNCVKPEVTHCSNEKAEQAVKDMILTYETTKQIKDTDSDYENLINVRSYNRIRKASNNDICGIPDTMARNRAVYSSGFHL